MNDNIYNITEDGITYYIVPQDVPLYRGDTGIYVHNYDVENTPTFFGFEKSRVKKYGMLFEFKIKGPAPLKLVALDKPNDLFFAQSSPKIQKILTENYGFNLSPPLRYTIRANDYELVEDLCKRGYDGYMIDEMDVENDISEGKYISLDPPDDTEDDFVKVDETKFHREAAICRPLDKLRLFDPYLYSDAYTQEQQDKLIREYKSMKTSYGLKDDNRKSKKSKPNKRPPFVKGESLAFSLFDRMEDDVLSSPSKKNKTTYSSPIPRNNSDQSFELHSPNRYDRADPYDRVFSNMAPNSPQSSRSDKTLTPVHTPPRKKDQANIYGTPERMGGRIKYKRTKKRTRSVKKKHRKTKLRKKSVKKKHNTTRRSIKHRAR